MQRYEKRSMYHKEKSRTFVLLELWSEATKPFPKGRVWDGVKKRKRSQRKKQDACPA